MRLSCMADDADRMRPAGGRILQPRRRQAVPACRPLGVPVCFNADVCPARTPVLVTDQLYAAETVLDAAGNPRGI